MRKVPFLITPCASCGKQIYLWNEHDFYAVIKDKDKVEFFYVCPECGASEKHPECFLPTYLKEKLIHDAMLKKNLIDFILISFGIVVVGLIIVWFLFR